MAKGKNKEQPKEQILVFLLLEARGDVDACIKRLQDQSSEPYPLLNGSCSSAEDHGSYGVRCLGVKKVVRLRTAMLRNNKLVHKAKRKA